MIVKKSARGLIRYEEAAKNFTSVLYPKLIEVRSKYKNQISELRKNHKLLGIKYNFISKKYEFVNDPAKLEHNWMNDSWEYKSSIDPYNNNESSD